MADSNHNSKSSRQAPSAPRDALAALENLAAEPSANAIDTNANFTTNAPAPGPAAPQAATPPASPRPSAKPMPRPATPPARPSPSTTDNGLSASGFVSTLAKGGSGVSPAENDPGISPAGSRAGMSPLTNGDPAGRTPNPSLRPMPKPMPVAPTAAPRRANPLNQIQLAREVTMVAPLPAAAQPPAPGVPEWYHAAIPILYTVSLLLLFVGVWAVLGALALHGKVHNIPLIAQLGEGEDPDFWYYMPYVMLLCLPVALSLAVTARIMQRRRSAIQPSH